MKTIDRCLLVRLLHYDPATGIFRWRVNRGKMKVGDRAGVIKRTGYVQLKLDGRAILAHRAAWVYCYGCIPTGVEIDHWDGVKRDNRLENLRLCGDYADNKHNQRHSHFDSSTGLLGVSPIEGTNKFRADIRVRKEHHYLGRFPTAKAAYKAYLKAKRELHEYCTI